MKIDGGCHCGAIQFEADINTDAAMICHCTDCQALSATAFRVNVPATAENFKLTKGEPKIYVKIGDSGGRRAQAFCENCGSQIYAADADGTPAMYMIRVGTVNQRDQITPKGQIWGRSALKWLGDLANIPLADKT